MLIIVKNIANTKSTEIYEILPTTTTCHKMCVALPVLALLLPVVCQGTKLISLATKQSPGPFEVDTVDPVTGQFTELVDLGADSIPLCGALRNDNTFVYGTLFTDFTNCLVTVDLSTGKVQRGPRYQLWFFNVGFDSMTNQTFVLASSSSSSSSSSPSTKSNLTLMTRYQNEEATDPPSYWSCSPTKLCEQWHGTMLTLSAPARTLPPSTCSYSRQAMIRSLWGE